MRHFIWIIFLLLSLPTKAQTMGELFKTMPTDLLPGISEGNKTMLLVDSGQTAVPYALGEIRKLAQKADYLKIKTSEVGTTQWKLLPVGNDSTIVCMIKTVCAEACDSHITFYTTKWQKISSENLLPEFSSEIFFDSSKKKGENYKYAVSLQLSNPIAAEFDESGTDLKLTLDYKTFLTGEQIAEIQPFLKSDTIVLKWKNNAFRQ